MHRDHVRSTGREGGGRPWCPHRTQAADSEMSSNLRPMNRGRALASVAAAALVLFGASARPSAQAATPPAAEQTPPVAKPVPPPAPGSAYTYSPEGRRDPFMSLLGRGNDPK